MQGTNIFDHVQGHGIREGGRILWHGRSRKVIRSSQVLLLGRGGGNVAGVDLEGVLLL